MRNGPLSDQNTVQLIESPVGLGGVRVEIGATLDYLVTTYGDNAGGVQFIGKKARGNPVSPDRPSNGDSIVSICGAGWSGSAFVVQGCIAMTAGGNWSASSRQTQIAFQTTPSGSTNMTSRWLIEPGGRLRPSSDNAVDFGDATHRAANLHAMNHFIYTDRGLSIANQTDQAGAGGGTLTNAPAAGNPAIWLPVVVNGVNRSIPCW